MSNSKKEKRIKKKVKRMIKEVKTKEELLAERRIKDKNDYRCKMYEEEYRCPYDEQLLIGQKAAGNHVKECHSEDPTFLQFHFGLPKKPVGRPSKKEKEKEKEDKVRICPYRGEVNTFGSGCENDLVGDKAALTHVYAHAPPFLHFLCQYFGLGKEKDEEKWVDEMECFEWDELRDCKLCPFRLPQKLKWTVRLKSDHIKLHTTRAERVYLANNWKQSTPTPPNSPTPNPNEGKEESSPATRKPKRRKRGEDKMQCVLCTSANRNIHYFYGEEAFQNHIQQKHRDVSIIKNQLILNLT